LTPNAENQEIFKKTGKGKIGDRLFDFFVEKFDDNFEIFNQFFKTSFLNFFFEIKSTAQYKNPMHVCIMYWLFYLANRCQGDFKSASHVRQK